MRSDRPSSTAKRRRISFFFLLSSDISSARYRLDAIESVAIIQSMFPLNPRHSNSRKEKKEEIASGYCRRPSCYFPWDILFCTVYKDSSFFDYSKRYCVDPANRSNGLWRAVHVNSSPSIFHVWSNWRLTHLHTSIFCYRLVPQTPPVVKVWRAQISFQDWRCPSWEYDWGIHTSSRKPSIDPSKKKKADTR